MPKVTTPPQTSQVELWLSNIVREVDVDPRTILANPKNIREHSPLQRQIFLELVKKVGFMGRIIINDRSGLLIDGHMRVEEAVKTRQPTVPVQYVDLDDEQEAVALAFYDQIGREATIVKERAAELRAQIGPMGGLSDRFLDKLEKYEPKSITGQDEDDDDDDFDNSYEGGDEGFSDVSPEDNRQVTLFLTSEYYDDFIAALDDLRTVLKTKNHTATIIKAIFAYSKTLGMKGKK